MRKFPVDSKGFTLIELMIVVIIVGILATIAVPSYLGFVKKGYRTEPQTNLPVLRLLEEQYYSENSSYTSSLTGLSSIQGVLKGFQPGPDSQLKYTYSITQNVKVDGTALTPCFMASATPKSGTRVAGEAAYKIDCTNARIGGVDGTW